MGSNEKSCCFGTFYSEDFDSCNEWSKWFLFLHHFLLSSRLISLEVSSDGELHMMELLQKIASIFEFVLTRTFFNIIVSAFFTTI